METQWKMPYKCPLNGKCLTNAHSMPTQWKMPTQCPLNGKCLTKNLIYVCNAKTHQEEEGYYYVGLTEKTFKDRWYKHKNSFVYESKANSTELLKIVWECKNKGIEPILKWNILD